MAESLVDLVEQVKERERRLQTGMAIGWDRQQMEGLLLQMHSDMAEFMMLVVTWMQVREETERRHAYGG